MQPPPMRQTIGLDCKESPGLAPIYSFVICNILVVELVPEKPGFSILLVPQRIYLFCASALNNHQIRAKIWKTFFNFAFNQFLGRFWVHFLSLITSSTISTCADCTYRVLAQKSTFLRIIKQNLKVVDSKKFTENFASNTISSIIFRIMRGPDVYLYVPT